MSRQAQNSKNILPGYKALPALRKKRISLGQRIAIRRMNLATYHHHSTRGVALDFDRFHYLRSLYSDPSEAIYLQTGAQSGKTEWMVCDAFAVISLGIPYQLVQPKDDIRDLFVKQRINPLLLHVDFYREHVKSTKNLIQWRDAEGGTLRVTFSNREDEMLSFPADAIGVDERDVCNLANIVELGSRQLQSEYRIQRHASTPRVPGPETINHLFLESNQKEWHVTCKQCGTTQPMDWYANVVRERRDASGEMIEAELLDTAWSLNSGRDIHVYCRSCATPLNRHALGEWSPLNKASLITGYHLNKLSSPMVEVSEMWAEYSKAKFHPKRMQHFCNSFLGLPYAGSGDKITEEMLERCAQLGYMEPDRMTPVVNERCTMGIDVGPGYLDVRISRYPAAHIRHAAFIGKVKSFDVLADLCQCYHVAVAVIDAEPESRKAAEFQDRMRGQGVFVLRVYERRLTKVTDVLDDPDERMKARETGLMTVDRTFMMDCVQQSVARQENLLPANYRMLSNQLYVSEMTTPTRVYTIDEKTGRPEYTWTHGNDHSFHADLFDLIAARFHARSHVRTSVGGQSVVNIGGVRIASLGRSVATEMA